MSSMSCPRCRGYDVRVTDSRPAEQEESVIRRRRGCLDCYYRWTTYESSAPQMTGVGREAFRAMMRDYELLANDDRLAIRSMIKQLAEAQRIRSRIETRIEQEIIPVGWMPKP